MKKYFRVIVLFVVITLVSCNNPAESTDPINLSVHFLELGNQFIGDCVFIDYGDTEIIIDAGSKFDSAQTIRNYINEYIEDGKLEFVIATHAHEDHISAFADHSFNNNHGILSSYKIGTIIDFPQITDDLRDEPTSTYTHYIESRDNAIAAGARYYNALQCYNNENGAQRLYQLGNNVSLEILYNYYYDYEAPEKDENHYSVCVMLHNGEQQYLFTGDMEAQGEEKLVEHYTGLRGGLGHCELFKGAHHGSNTSNTETLLNAITPDYVCICTCCGSSEYTKLPGGQFPTQTTINNIAKHTDKIFATTLGTAYNKDAPGTKLEPMNGNIVFSVAPGGQITVTGSNNSTPLKDTAWFKKNRTIPAD